MPLPASKSSNIDVKSAISFVTSSNLCSDISFDIPPIASSALPILFANSGYFSASDSNVSSESSCVCFNSLSAVSSMSASEDNSSNEVAIASHDEDVISCELLSLSIAFLSA